MMKPAVRVALNGVFPFYTTDVLRDTFFGSQARPKTDSWLGPVATAGEIMVARSGN